MKFEVRVSQTVWQSCRLTIEAPDEETAEQLALERANEVEDWYFDEIADREVIDREQITANDDEADDDIHTCPDDDLSQTADR